MLERGPGCQTVTREVDIGDLRNPDSSDRMGKSGYWNIVPAEQDAIGLQPERIRSQSRAQGSRPNEKTPSADLH
jgi:hypothetical protein